MYVRDVCVQPQCKRHTEGAVDAVSARVRRNVRLSSVLTLQRAGRRVGWVVRRRSGHVRQGRFHHGGGGRRSDDSHGKDQGRNDLHD